MMNISTNAPASPAATPVLRSPDPSRDVLLALDLGTTTGFALRGADGAITSGTAEFRLDRWQSGGMRFLRFKHWLTEIKHQAGGVDLVVYEQVRRHAGVDAAHVFGGWLAILTAWCDHHGIAYQGVPVGTIKRHVTGKGIRTAFRMRRFAAGARTVRITATAPMGGGHDEAGLWVESVALAYEIYNVG